MFIVQGTCSRGILFRHSMLGHTSFVFAKGIQVINKLLSNVAICLIDNYVLENMLDIENNCL